MGGRAEMGKGREWKCGTLWDFCDIEMACVEGGFVFRKNRLGAVAAADFWVCFAPRGSGMARVGTVWQG
jgi:hypothetical protein